MIRLIRQDKTRQDTSSRLVLVHVGAADGAGIQVTRLIRQDKAPGGGAGNRILIRLLPSRVGFAERDASRPAFGGSSLLSRIRLARIGVGPYGDRMCVRA